MAQNQKRFIRPLDVEVDKSDSIQLLDTGLSLGQVATIVGGIIALLVPGALWLYDLKNEVNQLQTLHQGDVKAVEKQSDTALQLIKDNTASINTLRGETHSLDRRVIKLEEAATRTPR